MLLELRELLERVERVAVAIGLVREIEQPLERLALARVEAIRRLEMEAHVCVVLLLLGDVGEHRVDDVAVLTGAAHDVEVLLRAFEVLLAARELRRDVVRVAVLRVDGERGLDLGLRLLGLPNAEVREGELDVGLRVGGCVLHVLLRLVEVLALEGEEVLVLVAREPTELPLAIARVVFLRGDAEGALDHVGGLLAFAPELERLHDLRHAEFLDRPDEHLARGVVRDR